MGAPSGNQNAAKAKMWHGAIMRALERRGGGDKLAALDLLAEKLLDAVADGDLPAIKELGDRIDGKPKQQVELSGDAENPVTIQEIKRTIVDARNPDS